MNPQILKDVVTKTHAGRIKFPEVVGTLLEQNVESYHVDFVRSESRYYTPEGESAVLAAPHPYPRAAKDFDAEAVRVAIGRSQRGEIDYLDFIRLVTGAGCVYYIACLQGKRVVYFGRNGDSHVEHFPKKIESGIRNRIDEPGTSPLGGPGRAGRAARIRPRPASLRRRSFSA